MNEIKNMNNNNFDIQTLMNIVGQTSMSVQGVAQQLGIVATEVTNLRSSYNNLESRMEQLELNEEVTSDMKTRIHNAANARIKILLGEKDTVEYAKYSRGFYGMLWTDSKANGGVGNKIEQTKKRDYQRVLDYIDSWIPSCGVSTLKKYIDERAKAKKIAREQGYV